MLAILKKYWLGIFLAVLFSAAVFLIYMKLHPKVLPENLVQGTGRMDGDLINLNAKYPGRLAAVDVEEGELVRRGQTLATLDSKEHAAKQGQITAQLEAKIREYEAHKIELDILRQTLPQSLRKAEANLAMSLKSRDELEQTINTQQNLVAQSEKDWKRVHDLVEKRLIEMHRLETASLALQSERDRLAALMLKRGQLDDAVRIAESSRIEASAAQSKIAAMEEGNKALLAGIEVLKASKEEIEAVLNEMRLDSPVDGYVIETIAHAGEVVGGGSPVVTLIDPARLYLKIFVDTLQNGKIKIGDKAVIFLDAVPHSPIHAKVVRIEQRAEFTPKEVSVASDRIQRVYAVHLLPLEPDPLLKLGLPGVGVISLDGSGLPSSLDEVPE